MPSLHLSRAMPLFGLLALLGSGCQVLRSAKPADDPNTTRPCLKAKGASANEPVVMVRVGTHAPHPHPLPPGGATVGSLLFSVGVFGYDDTGAVTVRLPAVLSSRPIDIEKETSKLVVPPAELSRAVVQLTVGREGQLVRLTFPLALAVDTTLCRLELGHGDEVSVVDLADTQFSPDSALGGQSPAGQFSVMASGRPDAEFKLTTDKPMTVTRFISEERYKPFLPDQENSSDTIIGVRRERHGGQTELLLFPLNHLYLQARTTLAHESLPDIYRTGVFYKRLILPGDDITVGPVEEVPEVLVLLLTPLADRLNTLRDRRRLQTPPRLKGPVAATIGRLGVERRVGR